MIYHLTRQSLSNQLSPDLSGGNPILLNPSESIFIVNQLPTAE
ncbi:hypothetical protein [Flavobacterium frigidarium]|nr:hypothetical protein [Flavobacterium frigidarium]